MNPATGMVMFVKFVPAKGMIAVFVSMMGWGNIVAMLVSMVPIKIIGMRRIKCCAAKAQKAQAQKEVFEACFGII